MIFKRVISLKQVNDSYQGPNFDSFVRLSL